MLQYSSWNPNEEEELIEGFLGLNIGGKKTVVNKSHTENIRDSLNETINKTFMSNEAGLKQTVSLSQNMQFDFTDCDKEYAPIFAKEKELYYAGKNGCISNAKTSELIKACSDAYPEVKISDVTPCRAENIEQSMVGTFDASMEINDEMTKNVKDLLKENLENRINDEEDTFGATLNTLAEEGAGISIAGSSNTTNDNTVINKTTIVDRVVNMVDQNFVKTLNQKLAGTQTIKVTGGTTKFVTQSMTVHTVAKMTADNKIFQDVMKDVERVDKKIIEKKNKGVTDIAETVGDVAETGIETGGDVANNAIDTGGDVAKSALSFLPYVIGGIILLMLILWLSGALETGTNAAANVAQAKAGVPPTASSMPRASSGTIR
jgi:hypothetical protein